MESHVLNPSFGVFMDPVFIQHGCVLKMVAKKVGVVVLFNEHDDEPWD